MAELSVLLENKKELVDHLNDILVDPLFQKLQSLYDETRTSLTMRDSSATLLKRFQEKLTLLPEWTKEMKHATYQEIVDKIGVTYIGELIQGILVTQIKIIIKTENAELEVPKLKFRVPSAENFVHMSLVVISRTIWKQTYLMYHNVRSLERQHNISQIEDIIRKSISSTIRSCLPLDELFKYIKSQQSEQDDEEDEEEEADEEDEEDDDEAEDESDDDEDEEDEEDDDEEEDEDEEDESDDEAEVVNMYEIDKEDEQESDEDDDEDDDEDEDEEGNVKVDEIAEPVESLQSGIEEIVFNKDRKVVDADKLVFTLINNDFVEKLPVLDEEVSKEVPINGYDRDDDNNTDESISEEDLVEVIKMTTNNSTTEVADNLIDLAEPAVLISESEPISPGTQSVEELEKELEDALETITNVAVETTNEVIEEQPVVNLVAVEEPKLHKSKPKQLPLRIVPLHIKNEILRQQDRKVNAVAKKSDAFF